VEKDHNNGKKWNEPGKNAPGGDRFDVHQHPLGIAEKLHKEWVEAAKQPESSFQP
jgi:hypothetical protein